MRCTIGNYHEQRWAFVFYKHPRHFQIRVSIDRMIGNAVLSSYKKVTASTRISVAVKSDK